MRLKWCEDLVKLARILLEKEGWVVRVMWSDSDHPDLPEEDPLSRCEPEVIAWWDGAESAHIRILMGEDDSGEGASKMGFVTTPEGRYMFGAAGVQGAGGIPIPSMPCESGILSLVGHFKTWRCMVTALQQPKKKNHG